MTISEKVAYLKGLAEGLGVDEKSKDGKLFTVIIDILEEVGLSIEDLEENDEIMMEELDAISDDLSDVEDEIWGEDEDECDCCYDDDDFFEVECPNCGEALEINEDVLDAGVIECPGCGQKFALDLYDEDDGCGCGCCEHDEPEEEPPVVEEPPKKTSRRTKKTEK